MGLIAEQGTRTRFWVCFVQDIGFEIERIKKCFACVKGKLSNVEIVNNFNMNNTLQLDIKANYKNLSYVSTSLIAVIISIS